MTDQTQILPNALESPRPRVVNQNEIALETTITKANFIASNWSISYPSVNKILMDSKLCLQPQLLVRMLCMPSASEFWKGRMKMKHIARFASCWITLFLFCNILSVQAQVQRRQPSIADLKKMPGQIVAEVHSAVPETPMNLTGYRVERLTFSPMNTKVGGMVVQVSESWRITAFFDKPLTVRNAAFSLVIDGQWCGFLAESPDLLSADAICFNSSLIQDGAAIGVTYRDVSIEPPDGSPDLVSADPVLLNADPDAEIQGEPIYYSSAKLSLQP